MKVYEAAFERLPAAQRTARLTHLRSFLARGFPTKREEDWRYTDLSALADRPFAPAGAAAPAFAELAGTELLAFANGQRVHGDARLTGGAVPDTTPDGVTALNAAFATTGLDLTVPARLERPPLLLATWFGGEADGMAHLRHRVRLERGAHAVLVVQETGDAAPFLATQVFDVELAPGAHLDLFRIQDFGAATTALTRLDVRVERDASFDSVTLCAGGALVRNDLNVVLDGPGAQTRLHGVLAPGDAQHLDVHTRIEHRAPHGTSRETFRGLYGGRARGVFNGKVVVHPGAVKTDSEQHVDSLLLSATAEVNAKPELEIHADDVKCAHGATCGQLDEDAIYYLRSRGLPRESARNLLLFTFAHAVLRHVGFEPARRLAETLLLQRLPGGAGLQELL